MSHYYPCTKLSPLGASTLKHEKSALSMWLYTIYEGVESRGIKLDVSYIDFELQTGLVMWLVSLDHVT